MQPSASDKGATPSTKAALDHLQLLIEHLLHENHTLKHSLRETSSQLDQVRAHLNRFKHQLADHETNDRLVRTHIQTMATLIQRNVDTSLSLPHPPPTTLPPSMSSSSHTPPSHTLPSPTLSSPNAPSRNPSSPGVPSPNPPSPSPPPPSAPSRNAPSRNAPPRNAPLRNATLRNAPPPGAPLPNVPPPSVSSPNVPSPSAPSPSAPSPNVPSPKEPSPKVPLLNALLRRAPARSVSSPSVSSPSAPSPKVPSPKVPSPNAPSHRTLTRSVPSPNVPSSNALSQRALTRSVPSPSVPSPKVPSPKVPSPSSPLPCPPPPCASSSRPKSLKSPSPRPPSPALPSPALPPLGLPSRELPSPGPPSPGPPSPGPPSPRTPSPRTPSPRTPSPRTPSPRPPSPRPPSPRTPSPRTPSPRTPPQRSPSPGTISRSPHRLLQAKLPAELASVSRAPLPAARITKPQDIYASPKVKVNGNGARTLSTTGNTSPSYTESTPERLKHTTTTESRCISRSPIDMSTSRSPGTESSTENRSAPTTSVSDALQKAFVAMEKDTTNAIHVLHDPSHSRSLRAVQPGEHGVESDPRPPSPARRTTLPLKPSNSRGANGVHGEELHSVKKQPKRYTRKRSLKAFKRKAETSSPVSDSALPLPTNQSSFTGASGRLKRSLTHAGRESPKSPPRSAKSLAKTLALKRTKKGFKVSLGLSRDSKKSGKGSSDSSSSSSSSSSDSDSDSDSSGPGCSVSLSRPHNRPGKAQVSMEGGLSDLISAARKLKDSLPQRKDDGEESHASSSSGSDSEESQSGSESNHTDQENTGNLGIANGAILSAAVAAAGAGTLCAVGSSEEAQESVSGASGIPKLGGIVGEQNNNIQAAPAIMQNHMTGWSTWQLPERSYPCAYGTTGSFPKQSYATGFPRNPVVEPEKRPSSDDSVTAGNAGMHQNGLESHSEERATLSHGLGEDFVEHSPAAGKATESEVAESEEDAEYPVIHEITHVPAMPRATSDEEKVERASSSRTKTSKVSQRSSTEFLTIHSCGSQLLRWKACPGSRYIDVSRGALAVKHPAAIALEDGRTVMNGKMRILEPLRVESSEANHCFASPMYPDGSFLPYVPVSGVALHARPVHWDNSRYAHRSVQLSFPKEIFDVLVLHVRRAYRKRHPSAHLRFPGAFLAGNRVRKVVKVEPDCSVNMTKLHRSPTKCSVADAVASAKKDIIGLALLYISIEQPPPDSSSAEVTFGLHSMVAHHSTADRKR